MSKSEEILRPSDYVDDPGECLFDEFMHNFSIDAEEVTDPKQLLGFRIRRLRIFRDMTQEEAAAKAGINTTLWRHYEHHCVIVISELLKRQYSSKVDVKQSIEQYFFEVPNDLVQTICTKVKGGV